MLFFVLFYASEIRMQPVKPTAIRASKVDPSVTAVSNAVNNNGSSSNSTSNNSSSTTISNNNTSKTGLISSTPSKNHANAAAPLPTMLVLPQPPNSIPIIGPAFAAVAKQHPSEYIRVEEREKEDVHPVCSHERDSIVA